METEGSQRWSAEKNRLCGPQGTVLKQYLPDSKTFKSDIHSVCKVQLHSALQTAFDMSHVSNLTHVSLIFYYTHVDHTHIFICMYKQMLK